MGSTRRANIGISGKEVSQAACTSETEEGTLKHIGLEGGGGGDESCSVRQECTFSGTDGYVTQCVDGDVGERTHTQLL